VLLGRFSADVLRRYERLPVPVVLVDLPSNTFQGHMVCANNVELGERTAFALMNKGHRNIAFLRYINLRLKSVDPDAQERQIGIERMMKQNPGKHKLGVYNTFRKDTEQSACYTQLFSAKPRYTALITNDVAHAQLAMKAAELQGIRVPKDLEIVTFKAESEREPIPGPIINFEKMGREAVLLLHKPRRPQIVKRIID
jgi:DNA-binding LacI/PurR family transcriptional regulator